jgi:hypothetical protein
VLSEKVIPDGPEAYDDALPKSGRRGRRRGHIPFTKPAKKVLELSLREALAHNDNWIGCEHIARRPARR